MDNKTKIKNCFGDQGGAPLHGEIPEDCLNCEIDVFNRCHKVSIATSLQGLCLDLGLLIQNGLQTGWLKSFNESSNGEKDNN